jgi:Ca2+:H+ antiporter
MNSGPLTVLPVLREEPPLLVLIPTVTLFLALHDRWLGDLSQRAWAAFLFAWLFAAIVWGAKTVVRHADVLAFRLGEPYGTLILTMSVASIEIVTVVVVMLTGKQNPTLARDTMFSVVMIVLNGLVGLGLLLGGLRYREQAYNLRGVNSYLSVIVALSVFGLIMPNFTTSTAGPTFSAGQETFLIAMCVGLYAVFLAIQTTRHRSYFIVEDAQEIAASDRREEPPGARSTAAHAGLLVGYLVMTVVLADQLAVILNHIIEVYGAPPAFGALLVAILVLTPEGLGALKAALMNQLQRAINILLGSVLATLALTIPAVLVVGLLQRSSVTLGLNGVEGIMLALTLAVGIVTFSSGRTNVLQGAVHLVLFLAYLLLIFRG